MPMCTYLTDVVPASVTSRAFIRMSAFHSIESPADVRDNTVLTFRIMAVVTAYNIAVSMFD